MDLRSIPRFVCALGFGLTGTAGCSIHLGLAPQPGPLQETVVAGDAGPKFALIELRGVISESAESSLFAPDRPSHVSLTLEALDRAARGDADAAHHLRRLVRRDPESEQGQRAKETLEAAGLL